MVWLGVVLMQRRYREFLAASGAAAVLVATSIAVGGNREQHKVTDMEIAQLPKFCWTDMGSRVAKGPEFSISRSERVCGPGVNHYCEGLLFLLRAKQARNTRERSSLLGGAEKSVRYTLNAIKNYPNCTVRGHAEATMAEILAVRAAAGPSK